jgi:hypothetical protein
MVAADLDGDQAADLVIVDGSRNSVNVLPNDGTGWPVLAFSDTMR